MIHQDDLQFWLLEHKTSKSHNLTELGLANKIGRDATILMQAIGQNGEVDLTAQEILETAIRLSVNSFILAEKIKI